MELLTDLKAIVERELGANATPSAVIDHLYRGASVTDKTMRAHIVRTEFFRIMAEAPDRRAISIEHELSERYGISVTQVRYYRNDYARGGARRKCGARKVK